MGTISSARAIYGLNAAGTPTGTNITGTSQIGVAQTSQAFADADIAYSFKVTSTAPGDVATLTLSTGAVAQTTGTPTITDGDGKDFEGATLPTLVTLFSFLMTRETSEDTISVLSSSDDLPDVPEFGGGLPAHLATAIPGGVTSPGTIAITFTGTGDIVTVTVIGKSS